jgi:TetR/AcrR family transcriptional regulator
MEENALEPGDRTKLVRQRDRFERALRALVKEGIEDGSVVPCDPKLAIFVILGALNWVPKWFKPSGPWKPEQLTLALSQIFERALSSAPATALPRDVGDLPTHDLPKPISFGRRAMISATSSRAAPKQKRAGGKSLP